MRRTTPDNADAFYNLGLVHEKMGHYREAEAAFVQTAKLNPDHQDVYFALGTLYQDRLSDNAKSVEAFRRYLQLGRAYESESGCQSSGSGSLLPC